MAKKIIVSEEQLTAIVDNILKEDSSPVPNKMNKPFSYPVNPDKVMIVKRFLDGGFKKGNYENIGADGMPCNTKIVAMLSSNGEPLKNMYLDQLQDLLIDKFQKMFVDDIEREAFMKQVMNDWFDDKISPLGMLSVNRLQNY